MVIVVLSLMLFLVLYCRCVVWAFVCSLLWLMFTAVIVLVQSLAIVAAAVGVSIVDVTIAIVLVVALFSFLFVVVVGFCLSLVYSSPSIISNDNKHEQSGFCVLCFRITIGVGEAQEAALVFWVRFGRRAEAADKPDPPFRKGHLLGVPLCGRHRGGWRRRHGGRQERHQRPDHGLEHRRHRGERHSPEALADVAVRHEGQKTRMSVERRG